MNKYLPLAALLLAGCADSEPLGSEPISELRDVRIDVRSGLLHAVFRTTEGETTTVVLTPEGATRVRVQLSQALAQRLQTVEQ
jgi:hypothetical protein